MYDFITCALVCLNRCLVANLYTCVYELMTLSLALCSVITVDDAVPSVRTFNYCILLHFTMVDINLYSYNYVLLLRALVLSLHTNSSGQHFTIYIPTTIVAYLYYCGCGI